MALGAGEQLSGGEVRDADGRMVVAVDSLPPSVVTVSPTIGAPTTGTWQTGQAVIDLNGMVWTCTAGGMPGTWQEGATGGSTDATVLETQQSGGAYTFALADSGTVVAGTSGSAQTFTIPANATVAFLIGTVIEVFQDGAGQITIAAAGGVTLRSDGGKVKTAAQYSTIGLRKRATNEWVLTGDLA